MRSSGCNAWVLVILSGLLGACRSAPTPAGSAPAPAARPPAVAGVQLYSVRKQLDADLDGTLSALATMGFRDVETHKNFLGGAAPFRAALDQHGLRVRSMMATFEELTSDPAALIADAKVLGTGWVVCPWIPHDKDAGYTAADNEKAIALWNQVGPRFKQAGLRFAYHPHGYEFHDGGTGRPLIDQMIERTRAGEVDYEMDVFWVVHAGQDPVAYLKRFPGRFVMFHIKDMKAGTPTGRHDGRADVETSQVTLGTGIINFGPLIAEARGQGASLFMLEDESSRSMEQLPVSLAALRAWLR